MIGGFALVAYPAEYGNSGVMTFLVNHNGVVYQKDLGTAIRPASPGACGASIRTRRGSAWTTRGSPQTGAQGNKQ